MPCVIGIVWLLTPFTIFYNILRYYLCKLVHKDLTIPVIYGTVEEKETSMDKKQVLYVEVCGRYLPLRQLILSSREVTEARHDTETGELVWEQVFPEVVVV